MEVESSPVPPWDLSLLASDPARGKYITFSRAYCEIPAVLMVRISSIVNDLKILSLPQLHEFASADVTAGADPTFLKLLGEKHVPVVTKAGAAYDLWLKKHYGEENLRGEKTNDDAVNKFFEDDNCVAIAGLGALLQKGLSAVDSDKKQDFLLIPRPFMSVQQSIAVVKEGSEEDQQRVKHFLDSFVREKIEQGFVGETIKKYGKEEQLSVASGN